MSASARKGVNRGAEEGALGRHAFRPVLPGAQPPLPPGHRSVLSSPPPPTCQSSTPVSFLPPPVTHPGRFPLLCPRRGARPRPAPPQAPALGPHAHPRAAPHPGNRRPRPGAGSPVQGEAGPAPRSPVLGACPGGHQGGGGWVGGASSRPERRASASAPGRRRAVRPAPQGAGTGPSRAGALGPRRPAGQRLGDSRGVRASAEAPPRPARAPSSAGRPAPHGHQDGSPASDTGGRSPRRLLPPRLPLGPLPSPPPPPAPPPALAPAPAAILL